MVISRDIYQLGRVLSWESLTVLTITSTWVSSAQQTSDIKNNYPQSVSGLYKFCFGDSSPEDVLFKTACLPLPAVLYNVMFILWLLFKIEVCHSF